MNMKIIYIAITLWLASCGLAFAQTDKTNDAREIKDIRIEGSITLDDKELLYLLDLAPGQVLMPQSITRGIKRLFLKGIYEDVQVGFDEEADGTLVVIVREKLVASSVSVHVQGDVDDGDILERLRVKEGDFISEQAVDEERRNVQEVLAKMGYPSASVIAELRQGNSLYARELAIGVECGQPMIINDIVIVGRPEAEVKKHLSLGTGDVFDGFVLDEDMAAIGAYYRKRGYLNPEIGPYTFKNGVLLIGVRSGIKLNVFFKGNEFLTARTLRDALPFKDAGKFSNDLMGEAVSRLQELYKERGYPSAQIAPVVSEAEDAIDLHFYVYEGSGSALASLNFLGTRIIPQTKLLEISAAVIGQPFKPSVIEQDIENIREFYVALGYKDVKISLPSVSVRNGKVSVEIDIDEGERVLIGSTQVVGDHQLPAGEIEKALKVSAGAPYNEVDISDSRRALLSLCREYGFYQCKVDVSRAFGAGSVDLTFTVDQGTKFFFGKTVVTGNRQTNLRVISRSLQYSEGMPLDTALLTKTRQKLYTLGLFSDVEVEPVESRGDELDVAVRVKEGDAGNVEFTLGYGEYERQRGSFDISYNNLFGMNRYASFRTEHSTLWNKYILNYNEPSFFDTDIVHKSSLSYEYRKDKNIDTDEINYEVKKTTASTGLEKNATKHVLLSIYYEYAIVDTYNVQPDVELSKEDSETLAISSIKPGIYFNNTDDPIEPTSGVNASLYVKMATKYLASKTDFAKTTAGLSVYQKLFTKRLVAAVAFKGGYAERFYDTEDLPLVERFFLGGRNSVRGYAQDMLGPKSSSDTATGGNSFLQFNVELRVRLSKSWSIVPFVDAGNVWENTSYTTVRNLKYTAGMGVRCSTPVGPFRVDYGRKLDQADNESISEIHFSIGHTF